MLPSHLAQGGGAAGAFAGGDGVPVLRRELRAFGVLRAVSRGEDPTNDSDCQEHDDDDGEAVNGGIGGRLHVSESLQCWRVTGLQLQHMA